MIWLTSVLRTFVLLLMAVLVVAAVLAIRIAIYDQQDNGRHLESKRVYLSQLAKQPVSARRPNVLFVLYDDLGYGDVGAYGAKAIETPTIDQLAEEGLRFTEFYSPAGVCTPARAAYLTGRFAPRAGLTAVVFPDGHAMSNFQKLLGGHVRLPAEEVLLPEILSAAGYDTAMVGKWHLGDVAPSRPVDFGFDRFFGALYSNDMTPFALYRGESVELEAPVDQRHLDTLYTDEVLRFIKQPREKPFFLYFAHSFPHIPLFVPDENRGKSKAGLYGDVVEGLDRNLGRIIAALKASGQLDNTLIIVTSDNGPWYEGNPGSHRGRKGSVREGGVKVPFIVHWSNGLDGGKSLDALAGGVDIVPTLLDILNLPSPADRKLDGHSLLPLLTGEMDRVREFWPYFAGERLVGLRDARFKLFDNGIVYATEDMNFAVRVPQPPMLFDLAKDASESWDASLHYPRDLRRMQATFDRIAKDYADNPRGWIQ